MTYSLSVAKNKRPSGIKQIALIAIFISIASLLFWLTITLNQLAPDDDYFLDTTVGELAVWMADQSAEEAPESLLGQYAYNRRISAGTEQLHELTLLTEFHTGIVLYSALCVVFLVLGGIGMILNISRHRYLLMLNMLSINVLLFIFPPSDTHAIVTVLLFCLGLQGLTILLFSDHVERVVGFLVIISLFNVMWEGTKFFAESVGYEISLPVAAWTFTEYATLEDALNAVQSGAIDGILADRSDLRDYMLAFDDDPAAEDDILPYPDLRYVDSFTRGSNRFGLPVKPELPGRVAVAVQVAQIGTITNLNHIETLTIGAVTDDFVHEKFLQEPRILSLIDLKIANNLNLPHLQSIAEALLQPARRNGSLLLVRILYEAALYTWSEAALGFVFGGLFGFMLGAIFAHVAVLQRSLLPYVVASQTVPIIALAPMIVIWLRDTHPLVPVAMISAYLTFFPVTINTLRGLQSPDPSAFDLMRSYAASRWQIMWKLRFPSSLPYIFTALKVSATASVVGAIIGELPSGIGDGLGRAILNFSSDYSLISTPKLWGSIFMAALLGVVFFLSVSLLEKLFVRNWMDK